MPPWRRASSSATAQARDRPSKVLVPRPISSRMTRERLPAWRRMRAVSVISTMKVDWPIARLSEAPTREKMRSHRPRRAEAAGTKEPICARMQMSAACRSTVDLPAMFGPVMRSTRPSSPMARSLGM